MSKNTHHNHGRSRRALARVGTAAALALTPATAVAVPVLAAPLVLEPADQTETAGQTETAPSDVEPIHRGGRGGRGGGSHHLSHGLPSTGSAF
ncbi:hypothetical protein AB4305_22250 [Nocardia sp. 2YAB30]|uniref:hypothetical protein n=1 Tax=unclassified Nocardia TaxID=2637762 RepID=UPI003F94DBAF